MGLNDVVDLMWGFPPGASGTSAPADVTAPTVEITSAAAATVYEAFDITVTFSEPVTWVTGLTVGNGTASELVDGGDGTTWTSTITPTAPGDVTVGVAEGAAQDAALNDNEAATQFTRFSFGSGVTLHIDFATVEGLFQSSDGTTAVAADGDPIGFATNYSPTLSNDPAQDTTSAKPTWKANVRNGLGVARFDGGDFLVTASGQFVNGTTGVWTAFAVAKATDSTGVENVLDSDDTQGAQVRVAQFIRFNGAYAESICFNTAPAAGTDTCATAHGAAWVILSSVRSATGVEIFQNGSGNGESALSGTPATTANLVAIGASNIESVKQKLTGDVGEVLIYNAALSAANRQSVEAYLSAKWGITLA